MSSFDRIYWFYNRLKQDRHPTRQGYMDTFEVSESTFKRDIALLRDRMGAPLEYDPERNGYFLTDAAYEIPSFWFNRRQLLLMIGICKQLQKVTDSPDDNELTAFKTRLQHLLTLHDGTDLSECFSFEYVEQAVCDTRHIDLLMDAILQKRCIAMTYQTASTGQTSTRTMEPYRLHNYMGTWYLVGFCRRNDQPRIFQAGRIDVLDITQESFDSFRFDVNAFLDSSFGIFKGKKTFSVRLQFDAFISRFIQNEIWHSDQKISDAEDGGLVMDLPVSDLTEIRMKVLKYGRHVEVLAPDSLREQVVDEAKKIIEMYES
jgi:predicted DNA-binding transcriptional regulator YafY